MTTQPVGGEIFVNIRTEGGTGGGSGVPGAGGAPRPVGGGAAPKDPQMSMLNADQKNQLEQAREEKKALKEYQDFQKLKQKEGQNELLNELQRGRRQATMVAGAVTTGMLARNSKIMQSSMSALTTMFGAFIDVFLMPFIPLIIPVLKYIADLLPKWMEWTDKFAKLFADNPLDALKWAADKFKEWAFEMGIKIGEMLGYSKEEVIAFYEKVGKLASDVWDKIKNTWDTIVAYVKGVWEEAGCDLWTAVKAMAEDAWQASMGALLAAWKAFKEWQPGLATSIESMWASVSQYVNKVWVDGGCTVVGAFWEVAKDVGGVILRGLKWLWGEGGFKQALMGILNSILGWIREKTGLGPGNMGFVNPGSGLDEEGNRVNLASIHRGNISEYMTNIGPQGSANEPNAMWKLKNMDDPAFLKWAGRQGLASAVHTKIPIFGPMLARKMQEGNLEKFNRERYESWVEREQLPWHLKNLEAQEHSQQEIKSFMYRMSNTMQAEWGFKFENLNKVNDKWQIDVSINDGFKPPEKIDGFTIS